MKRITLLLLCGVTGLWASINGTVINRTRNKPQASVTVTLVKPGQQGMQSLGSTVSDASGRFAFENDQPGSGPELLQASYGGVTYNQLIMPNTPASKIQLDIFEATKSPAIARIVQHMLLLEPGAKEITASEDVIIQNASKTTYNNPALGGMRFFLPQAANGQVKVRVKGPQGMPLPRTAQPTEQPGVFKVDYPVKPGQTQFEVVYLLPVQSPFTFESRVVGVNGMPASPLRIIAPLGVTLASKDTQTMGMEPSTRATVYTVTAPGAFAVDIAGIGSLRPPPRQDVVAPSTHDDAPQVTEGPPKVYRHIGWGVALVFSILLVGFLSLFLNSPRRNAAASSHGL